MSPLFAVISRQPSLPLFAAIRSFLLKPSLIPHRRLSSPSLSAPSISISTPSRRFCFKSLQDSASCFKSIRVRPGGSIGGSLALRLHLGLFRGSRRFSSYFLHSDLDMAEEEGTPNLLSQLDIPNVEPANNDDDGGGGVGDLLSLAPPVSASDNALTSLPELEPSSNYNRGPGDRASLALPAARDVRSGLGDLLSLALPGPASDNALASLPALEPSSNDNRGVGDWSSLALPAARDVRRLTEAHPVNMDNVIPDLIEYLNEFGASNCKRPRLGGNPALIQAADAPVQVASDAPVQVASDTPVQVAADAPVQAADAPVQAADAPVQAAARLPNLEGAQGNCAVCDFDVRFPAMEGAGFGIPPNIPKTRLGCGHYCHYTCLENHDFVARPCHRCEENE